MGLANVVKSNLGPFHAMLTVIGNSLMPFCSKGPRGTLKMLVDGAGQIKMTKVWFFYDIC